MANSFRLLPYFHAHNILNARSGFDRDSRGKTASRFPLNGPENAERNKTILDFASLNAH